MFDFNLVFTDFFHREELGKLLGCTISDAQLKKVSSSAKRLFELQHGKFENLVSEEPMINPSTTEPCEFGSDLFFKAPARFFVDMSAESWMPFGDKSSSASFSHLEENENHEGAMNSLLSTNRESMNLKWLKNACDIIVQEGGSQLSGDELAMALCRVLVSNKAGDEVVFLRGSI